MKIDTGKAAFYVALLFPWALFRFLQAGAWVCERFGMQFPETDPITFADKGEDDANHC